MVKALTTFIKAWNGRQITDDGAYVSEEFKEFFRDFKKALKSVVSSKGGTLVRFKMGHYDMSGMMEKDGKYVYISYGPPRCMQIDMEKGGVLYGVLMRTSPDSESCSRGHGPNNFCSVKEMEKLFDTLT